MDNLKSDQVNFDNTKKQIMKSVLFDFDEDQEEEINKPDEFNSGPSKTEESFFVDEMDETDEYEEPQPDYSYMEKSQFEIYENAKKKKRK